MGDIKVEGWNKISNSLNVDRKAWLKAGRGSKQPKLEKYPPQIEGRYQSDEKQRHRRSSHDRDEKSLKAAAVFQKTLTFLSLLCEWIPAFAGMTESRVREWIPAFAGMTESRVREWIPAFAGMTRYGSRIPGSSPRMTKTL